MTSSHGTNRATADVRTHDMSIPFGTVITRHGHVSCWIASAHTYLIYVEESHDKLNIGHRESLCPTWLMGGKTKHRQAMVAYVHNFITVNTLLLH